MEGFAAATHHKNHAQVPLYVNYSCTFQASNLSQVQILRVLGFGLGILQHKGEDGEVISFTDADAGLHISGQGADASC